MYRHTGHALWRCTIHIAPIGTCLTLLVLNIGNYYIGGELTGTTGEDTQKLAALQVASKLLELLMLSSLAAAMLTFIQRELTFGDGVPLGALLAAKEISSINYLWSSRFWGAVLFENDIGSRNLKKWLLIPLLTISTVLGVFVGPLSATLIIPRVDDWPAGGTAFWVNGTHDTLFPKRMDDSPLIAHCVVDTGDTSCPYGGWEIINQVYYAFWPRLEPLGSMPENIYMPSPYSQRHLTLRSGSNTSLDGLYQSIWNGPNTVASVPPSAVSDALAELARLWSFAARNYDEGRRYWSHKDATYTVRAPEPIVQVLCLDVSNQTSNGSASMLSIPILHVPVDQTESLQVSNATRLSIQESGEFPKIMWLDESDLKKRTNATLHSLVSIPKAANGQSLLFTCTIDSALPEKTISTSRNGVKIVNGDALGYASTNGQVPKVDLSAEWAKYLTPQTFANFNATIFSKIASTAGLWNTTTPSHSYNYQYIIESILVTLIANGLGRTTYNSSMIGHLRGSNASDPWGVAHFNTPDPWLRYILPHKNMGFNDDPSNSVFDPLPASLAAKASMFIMRATVNGYAFSARGNAARASIAALMTYIILAACHIVYSIRTGWASTANDSSLEVAMLAAGSKRTKRLKNTGAGTETVEVFEERVRMKVRRRVGIGSGTGANGRLELVFRDTEDGCEEVMTNVAYG